MAPQITTRPSTTYVAWRKVGHVFEITTDGLHHGRLAMFVPLSFIALSFQTSLSHGGLCPITSLASPKRISRVSSSVHRRRHSLGGATNTDSQISTMCHACGAGEFPNKLIHGHTWATRHCLCDKGSHCLTRAKMVAHELAGRPLMSICGWS